MRSKRWIGWVSLWSLIVATPALAATPEEKCEISKNKTAGAYATCRHKAEAKAIQKGTPADTTKCDTKFLTGWSRADTKAAKKGTVCVDGLGGPVMQGLVADHTTAAASAIGGGGMLADCGDGLVNGSEQCDGADLGTATCATLLPGLAPVRGSLGCSAQCTFDLTSCAPDPACSQPYVTLDEPDRNVTFNDGGAGIQFCDFIGSSPDWHGPGWYRLAGAAGSALPESPPADFDCGTGAGGWLNGVHPTVADGVVQREACFSFAGSTCFGGGVTIDVVHCGSHFLYNLAATPLNCLRYCGE